MASRVLTIADAVVTLLNDHFTETFTAERVFVPTSEVSELRELRVWVVPSSNEVEQETRQSNRYEVGVDIGVQKKLLHDTGMDPLMDLCEEIMVYLQDTPISGARLLKKKHDPIFSPEHWSEARVFTGIIHLTYLQIA